MPDCLKGEIGKAHTKVEVIGNQNRKYARMQKKYFYIIDVSFVYSKCLWNITGILKETNM